MIDWLELTNFRGFGKSTRLELKPFTVLVGRNSAGKSTPVAALLALKQTLEDPTFGAAFPFLRLSGSQIDLGAFADVVHGHSRNRQIQFSFGFDRDESKQKLLNHFPIRSRYLHRFGRRVFIDYDYAYPLASRRPAPQLRTLTLAYAAIPNFGSTLARMTVESDGDLVSNFRRTARGWNCDATHIPASIFKVEASQRSALFPTIQRERKLSTMPVNLARRVRGAEDSIWRAVRETSSYLQSMSFVGPFRTPPQRRYAFSGALGLEAGGSGEQTSEMLIADSLSEGQLVRQVQFWLQRLSLAEKLTVRPEGPGSSVFELSVSGAGFRGNASIADVGYGVSQVLPVIVQGLLAQPGGTFVVQQPELHLHPDAQATLVDFFIFLVARGVRCIVETHSEYFLVRLRRRVAERGVKGLLRDFSRAVGYSTKTQSASATLDREQVAVTFVETSQRLSTMRQVAINELYQLENLPANFMSEAMDDRIAIAKRIGKLS
ncbi:MAG: AAA family ATPase [Archangium sp.]|nr:AAA family ATPase [Archangium sp.]